jgi:hypothetical protein
LQTSSTRRGNGAPDDLVAELARLGDDFDGPDKVMAVLKGSAATPDLR